MHRHGHGPGASRYYGPTSSPRWGNGDMCTPLPFRVGTSGAIVSDTATARLEHGVNRIRKIMKCIMWTKTIIHSRDHLDSGHDMCSDAKLVRVRGAGGSYEQK